MDAIVPLAQPPGVEQIIAVFPSDLFKYSGTFFDHFIIIRLKFTEEFIWMSKLVKFCPYNFNIVPPIFGPEVGSIKSNLAL